MISLPATQNTITFKLIIFFSFYSVYIIIILTIFPMLSFFKDMYKIGQILFKYMYNRVYFLET